MVKQKELKKVVKYIQNKNFPDRLRLALYIYDFPNRRDCVYHRVNGKMECIYKTIYPINRLRNIAIENSLTSHFVVFDMDMWPACRVVDGPSNFQWICTVLLNRSLASIFRGMT